MLAGGASALGGFSRPDFSRTAEGLSMSSLSSNGFSISRFSI